MTEVKAGDSVAIHYKGTLSDGTVFDSSEGRDPLQFTVCSGQIIPGLDKALPGMTVGEEKTVNIPSEEAYGAKDPNATQPVPRDQLPTDIPLEVGTQLQVQTPDGQLMTVSIVEVGEENVVLDANHPLAGKDLTFEFSLVSIG
ncbi:FKBP-type peptidyl-prolyl cis-trans isomerase [Roseibium polysiphoniae]|uniref:Peptidyl-prolyl cis-trans isomerase n=1 Tax=Roseibium polysiphoniae TaxID=2571221 RepID=A0ABR9CG05_9HYPH|nr:peptidylprolyl isomerase [Roseibium polysiphoniae]MBD8878509.1 peptidylprolyl isomerase [Roseibium polysiphoniae]